MNKVRHYIFLISFLLIIVLKSAAQNVNYFSRTFTVTFPNGVSNQVVYLEFPNVGIWGNLKVTLSGGYNHQKNIGELVKKYGIIYNVNAHFSQVTEIPVSFGLLADQWSIGDFDNSNMRIPIYHLVNTGNQITIRVEGQLLHSGSVTSIESNLSLSSVGTHSSAQYKQYPYFNNRLGIGTEAPEGKLSIFSTSTIGVPANYNNSHICVSNGTHKLGIDPNQIYSNLDLLIQTSSNKISFWTNNNEEMVIGSGGKVGIGTTTPTNKLEVNGTIRSKEVKVEASPWPDYVFSKEYTLRPLQELNTYIQQHGSLPEIPTAKEVEENGIGLGEMNAKLLQKIEELTLYTIGQQKTIDKLLEKTNKQDKIIQELLKDNHKNE